MPAEVPRRPPAKICSGRYEMQKKLGAGCFAEVYKALDSKTGDAVAVKCEDIGTTPSQLEHGAKILSELQKPKRQQGFVETFYFGREGLYNCLVMELLGKSLEDQVQRCKGKLTPKTTVLIAQQVLCRIEYLHSKGIVHRDIKPENFMFGIADKIHHVYLIDFGLSKSYWDKGRNSHIPIRNKLSLTGTARYVSINAHKGYEQSRRDDMESIGHMFMYLLRGALPWSGLDAKTKQEKYRKIMEKKISTDLGALCARYPKAFEDYLRYARNLGFSELPDYTRCQEMLQEVRKSESIRDDAELEWFENAPPPGPLVAVDLETREGYLQPDQRRGGDENCFNGCFRFLRR